jgi:hypothetical protein
MSFSLILQLYDDRELTASLEIIIVESLHSTAPLLPSNLVLLAPGATFQLDTNRNSGKTTFRSVLSPSRQGCGSGSGLDPGSNGFLSSCFEVLDGLF